MPETNHYRPPGGPDSALGWTNPRLSATYPQPAKTIRPQSFEITAFLIPWCPGRESNTSVNNLIIWRYYCVSLWFQQV